MSDAATNPLTNLAISSSLRERSRSNSSHADSNAKSKGSDPSNSNRDAFWRICFYNLVRLLLMVFWTLTMRPRALGAGNVPKAGSLLIACNHQSYLDPPVIGAFTPRRIDYLARAGLFKNRLLGWLISALNAIPIRENESDTQAIKQVLQRLGEGRAVLIFPEGTRSTDGSMSRFKRGVALMVKKAACPVVPAAIEGAYDAWPRGTIPRPRGGRVYIAFGKPIPPEELMRNGPDAALRRLEAEIDSLRLDLRARLREASLHTYPLKGPGDLPIDIAHPIK